MVKLLAVLWSLAGLVFTVNGYRPLAKGGYSSAYAFTYGLFASELPAQMIGVHAGALAAISRRLSPRVRWFSWLLSGLSWLGLLGLNHAGRTARTPLTAALDAGLGTDRRIDTTGVWPRPSITTAAKSSGVLRMAWVRHRYVRDRNIRYGEYGRKNTLEVWRHPDLPAGGRAPVLLQVPGGAWMIGSNRGQAYPLMSHLAEAGWVCVSINYRLSPRWTWPDHIVDVKRAIAWVKRHIGEYGGDPDWLAITGGSAGGHLSALAALTPDYPQFQPGFEDADTRVRAAVPFYGVYDLTRRDASLHPMLVPMLQAYVFKQSHRRSPDPYRIASPVTHISDGAPPFLVLHGTNDSLIPVQQARDFTARLQQVSKEPVVYAELPYAQHAFDLFGSPRATHTAVAVEQFLAEVYAPLRADRASA